MRFLAILLALSPVSAFAAACGWNASHTSYDCSGFHSGAISGASAPTIADAIEQIAAALPTIPTPLGLEGSFQSRSAPSGNPKANVSLLKGFRSLGFAAGTWNEGSFPTPDLDNHFVGTPQQTLYRINAPGASGGRVAAALGVPDKLMPKGYALAAGASAGFGSGSGRYAPQAGIQAMVLGNLAVGYAKGYEQVSPSVPKVNTSVLTLGTQLFGLHVGFSYQTLSSSVKESHASSLSATYNRESFAAWLGQKWEKDQLGNTDAWGRFGLQWRMSDRVGASYEYGYYRDSHGISVQVNL